MWRWRRKLTRYMRRLLNAAFVLLAIAVIIYIIDKPDVALNMLKYFEQPNDTITSIGGNLKVHYVDVGESDCVLIEENGHFMLIDAGDVDDIDIILAYLKKQRVSELEYLVLSHPHADHIGAAAAIIKMYKVNHIIMPNIEHTTKLYKETIKAIATKRIQVIKPKVGDILSIGKAKINILAPNHYQYGNNLNNYSIALKITNGKNRFLFIGDNEKQAIGDILKNGKDLKADVYMCGHHGSSTSTTKKLLKRVQPKYAVISVGKNNYGHPNKKVLSMIKKRNIKLYRTDKEGTIVFSSDGNTIAVH